ncbi:putative protein-S-isoprenylcysteine O-methyltransferase [Hypsizygus marmoreus]|uniref:Protein-S-isoprenylcysteine O-methyltransferase n=1 Tax=Hypsizygus marmoreus TaxID=39966 RepID=A0A369J749_HYPMA|nr:putative protein-S-isoprenylcysteine O-methyltransferase [Hypsizygus marmoreus]
MSFVRVALVAVQAICNQLACTPPNPTPSKGRYHTDELYILQIAPLIFKIHQCIIWFCTAFEIMFYLATVLTLPPSLSLPLPIPVSSFVCPLPSPSTSVYATPLFVIGVLAVVLGTYIRLDCFRTLGQLFTFDLTVHPEHMLVTSRFYAYVRHPAYTGSILIIAGLAFSHLTQGAWMTSCGPLRVPGMAIVVWVMWWAWTLSVGLSRAQAEDKQMRKLFGQEWETYAAQVPWWFFPGII